MEKQLKKCLFSYTVVNCAIKIHSEHSSIICNCYMGVEKFKSELNFIGHNI